MNKTYLKIPPKMIFDSLVKAMQSLSARRITTSDANNIAEKNKELRKNNFTIDVSKNNDKSSK